MDQFTLRVFQSEVLLQCEFVLRAARLLDEWSQNPLGHDAQTRAAVELAEVAREERRTAAERGDWDAIREHARRETAARSRVPLVTSPTTGAWFAIQAILISAANISKLLWGSATDSERVQIEAERQPLRHSIGVRKTSPLRLRAVRNSFEHFDAELEALKLRGYVGRNIGPHGAISIPGTRRFSHYDPETGLVTFWRKSANIRKIIDEVRRIEPLVRAEVFEPL